MPTKLGRGLEALISKRDDDGPSPKKAELRTKLKSIDSELMDLKARTDALRKKLTMEIVMGSNPDMTELRSMEGRLLDLDLERKEILREVPDIEEVQMKNEPAKIHEKKKRSSEIDMDMIRIMITETGKDSLATVGETGAAEASLVNETDEILRDLRSLQESHSRMEIGSEADPVDFEKSPEPTILAASEVSDNDYIQSIRNEIHPKVTLRKLKQEARIPPAPTTPSKASVVVQKIVQPVEMTAAVVRKKLIRKVRSRPTKAQGSRTELSDLLLKTSALIEEGEYDVALPMLEGGMGKFGSDGDQSILCQIGSLYFEKGDLDKANERFRQVVKMNPLNARAINNMGVILKKQKRFEDSIRLINQAIEVDPNYERAWYELGCVFMEIQPPLLKEASIFLRRALEIDPRFEKAREQLSICTRKLHRT